MNSKTKNIISLLAAIVYSVINSLFIKKGAGLDFASILIAGGVSVVVYIILELIFPAKR
jgi:Na+/H+ antiporter NhaC